MEGILARGDRKIAQVILKAYQKGCIFDAWGEYYKHDVWMETLQNVVLIQIFIPQEKENWTKSSHGIL